MSDPTLQSELEQLQRCMATIATLKRIPIGKAVRNASRDFLQAAYPKTPVAKRSKDFIQVPGRGTRKGTKIWLHKGASGSRKWRGPWAIKNAGFARVSWIGAMAAMGMSTDKRDKYGKMPSARLSQAIRKSTAIIDVAPTTATPSVRIMDSVDYLQKLDARTGLASAGLQKAIDRIYKEIERMAERGEVV